ncbi:MAG: ParA family protein [Candidatus Sedimenticola endophacoides]
MKTLVIANQKGGVGKSTVSVHLVWGAIEKGLRVLLVDFDGQANSTHTFIEDIEPNGAHASHLFSKKKCPKPHAINDQLSIVPADIGINDVEGLALSAIEHPAAHLREWEKDYDLCIIDTPPNLGRRLLAALIASDAVVSPMALNGYSIDGLTELQRSIITVKKKFNPRLKNLGVLPNLVNQRSKTQTTRLEELRRLLGDKVLPYVLPSRVAVSDAIDNGHPVWKKARGQSAGKAAKEMRHVVNAVIERAIK